jgi:hypothetical protein
MLTGDAQLDQLNSRLLAASTPEARAQVEAEKAAYLQAYRKQARTAYINKLLSSLP